MIKKIRPIIVGIPGVGKTTIIHHVIDLMRSHVKNLDGSSSQNSNIDTVAFGTVMLEEANKIGITSRDDLRKLDLFTQKKLQENAAKNISSRDIDILLVDTHLFINSKYGLLPGLPLSVLDNLSPTNLILIQADPNEILNRRVTDETRDRSDFSFDLYNVKQDLELSRSMLSAISTLIGIPMLIVNNDDGKAKDIANTILQSITGY